MALQFLYMYFHHWRETACSRSQTYLDESICTRASALTITQLLCVSSNRNISMHCLRDFRMALHVDTCIISSSSCTSTSSSTAERPRPRPHLPSKKNILCRILSSILIRSSCRRVCALPPAAGRRTLKLPSTKTLRV